MRDTQIDYGEWEWCAYSGGTVSFTVCNARLNNETAQIVFGLSHRTRQAMHNELFTPNAKHHIRFSISYFDR